MKNKQLKRPETRGIGILEQRELTTEERAAGFIGVIRGSIPFNADSQVMQRRSKDGKTIQFVERIAPSAFAKSLKEDRDIVATAGHAEDPLSAFAIIGENLQISTNERSMDWEAKIPDTNAGKDLMRLVDMRVIRGTSFEFLPREGGETWEKRGQDMQVRTITDARLFEVNPVKWPAYLGTSLTVEMRGRYSGEDFPIDYWDSTVTGSTAYAQSMLCPLVCWLTNSLEYLRDLPDGPLAAFAKKYVNTVAAQIVELTAYLKDHGSEIATDGEEELPEAEMEAADRAIRSYREYEKSSEHSQTISIRHWQRRADSLSKPAV